ncbi:hypothetical protein DICVIV_01239 [Dictyocaulus viviparus]|uniref:Uncharacterized protein n=1 Tax=Dictyocaulus viviparus TaxID=29172 RepID=A0A0D8Y959_DICVI|nr:hypothetical protein DICVIV_01239 [Dictyocaulus viviparus]
MDWMMIPGLGDNTDFSYTRRLVTSLATEVITELRKSSALITIPVYSPRTIMANGKPMAPSNTTQFLLEDREARAGQGLEVELAYEESERRRVRSISVSSEFMAASEGASSSGDSETDKEMDREFEAEFEEYTMDRISKLTKDEMTREILDKEKNAELYQENMSKMMKENQRLRKMLMDNGISVDRSPTSQPVV